MRDLFDTFRHSLNAFFDAVDLAEMEKAFETIESCRGALILSGVGKSGFVAQKIAATLVSTGTRAHFLSPIGALHGDIGILSHDDLFLALSKSGESKELLDLLPFVKKKGVKTIAVVSKQSSRLAKLSDLVVHLPIERELCPYDLAPTISTAAQLIFGDCLAIKLMKKRQFTVSDFASNHPSGFLGKKITLKVTDLMLQGASLPICRARDRLIDTLHELTSKRCGCVLIVGEEARLEGIFTDGDLRRAIQSRGERALQVQMGELMTASPATIEPTQFAIEALRRMEGNPDRLITVLPVVENQQIVGLLRLHDIIQSGLG